MSDSDLPDLFLFKDGTRVKTEADWLVRRQELLHQILQIEYGMLPPAPSLTRGELLNSHTVARLSEAKHQQYRLHIGIDSKFSFLLDLLIPVGDGPFPVALNGDACWMYVTDDVAAEVLDRGFILAQFNRSELAPDNNLYGKATSLYQVYPGERFGAITAWAWGYHRCVDFLLTLPEVDANKIAVVGHSRGGKTVLLAGATDERIALTAPNDSGCAGAGCFRVEGIGSETLGDITNRFPYWFSPVFSEYIGRESDLPFDQHALKACVAPRALLSTEALGDLWANPSGTWQTHLAAREAYRFLEVDKQIGIHFRQGGHNHGLEDWQVFLDFAEWQFFNKPPQNNYNENPFPEILPTFSWNATARA